MDAVGGSGFLKETPEALGQRSPLLIVTVI